ncbi:TonB-dependent receptor [Flavobacterium gelidilacus]|uniref:TonB-dependent siderophore receptor n=1 Tax=Flavobacterium gelidilacus TaxID=206041 RepID=UPI0004113E8B|nr:TonB-dependent receptor [Flavobacterium gelidilacus]
MRRIYLTVAISLLSLSFYAQDSYKYEGDVTLENDTVKIKKYNLQEVVVTGKNIDNPISIGKTSIKPMDLPQASSVITNITLQNQQVNSITDILKNANGVYIMGTTGGYQEEIASRGFSLSSSNTFKNGVRYFNGMSIETSGLERVEFLKGSAAMLFGNVSPGGILNLVTKKPKYDFGGEVGFNYGSFNTIKPTLDVYGALNKNKTAAFRINSSYETADSYRNNVESERFYINPSFEFKLSKNTDLLIETDFTKDSRTPDFGAGIIDYKVVDLPRDRFLGVSWGKYDSQQFANTITLNHRFNSNWNINFVNGIRYYDTELFSNTRPNTGSNGGVQTNGDWNRSIQKTEAKDNYFMQQLDLKGLFTTGKIEHNVLFGADVENFKTSTTAYNQFSNYDTVNIFEDYNPANEAAIPTLTENTLTKAPINRFGVYAQDLISFSEKIKVLAGIRYSYQDTRSDVLKYSDGSITPTKNYDDAFSPRVGLIYQPTKNHSLFATYSNSFEINTGQDETGKALEPSIVDQYEIGIKNKLFTDKLYLNVTAYQISNDKFYQQSLANGNSYSYVKVLTGEVRSKGVEVDITANPLKGLTMIAGYSFNETKFLDEGYYIAGSLLRYNPKNTANLSANYLFSEGKLKGINLGLISTYFGERYAGRSTRTQVANDNRQLIYLQDFVQVDATLGYTFKQFRISTKLSNVFNELNYNVHDDNSVNPIAPRNYSIALNYKF